MLFFIEIGVVERLDVAVFPHRLFIKKAGDDAPFDDVLVDDLVYIFEFDLRIESALGIDDHDGSERAEAEAARLGDVDFLFQPFLFDARNQRIVNFHRIAGSTARTAANQNV